MTGRDPEMIKDLARADRSVIPVNLIYPSNYSAKGKGGYPAIILEESISATDALEALEIIGKWSEEGEKGK